jgi:single-stranded DNA-specific DHH superfamily exonuclease
MIPEEKIALARRLLSEAKRPLFLHDDDCDGLTSYVLCRQFCEGQSRGQPIKRSPTVGQEYVRYIGEHEADLVVILDKPYVAPEFFDDVKIPILWIDHHGVQTESVKGRSNVTYLNPRLWADEDNRPTVFWCYTITGKNLWLATVGCVADWHLPDFFTEFAKSYPDLVPKPPRVVEDLYVDSPIGLIVRVLQFNLKGSITDAKKSADALAKITSPYEITKQTTTRGRLLWRRYEALAQGYDALLERAKAAVTDSPILLFTYEDDAMTFTAELSNELLVRYPEKLLVIGRRHDGMYKCSLRSREIEIPPLIESCMQGLQGHGGGHKHACGLVVAEKDWETFLQRLASALPK